MKRKLYPVTFSLILAIVAGSVAAGASRLAAPGGAPALSLYDTGDGLPPLEPVGTSFTYQGRLLDGGSPASGSYDFTYKLFDTSGGSNQIGTTITHTFRTVTNGIFTDNLDFGDKVFLGDARWLEVAVRNNGGGSFTTLSPRQPITPAPYAVSAPWFGIRDKPTGYNPLRIANDFNLVDALSANTGLYTSVAIGADGLPIVSYQDSTNFDLKVAHCEDLACGTRTITPLDTAGTVGFWTSIALGSDGLPIISYLDNANSALKVAHCSNRECTAATITTVDNTAAVGYYSSITINKIGAPVISYYDSTNGDLKVAGCTNVTCTSAVISTVDSTGNVGVYTSSTLDSLGLVQISYYDLTNGNLKIAFCDDDRCTSAGFVTADSTGNVGAFTSIATGKDGLPIVSYIDRTNLNLKTMHCNNDICSSRTIRTIDTGIATASDDSYTSIAIGADGLPMIAYFNAAASDLKTAHCADVKCSNSVVRTLDSAGLVGRYTSLAIGIDGLPFISYEDETNGDLDTVDCGSPGCVSYGRKR